ncbi:MAG: hypothetical protein KGL39_07780 [Patescibacteria group bacterium]|nr:hypothetical protein [Patescibacteria group bacterium]
MSTRVSIAALGKHAQQQIGEQLRRSPRVSKYFAQRTEYKSIQGFTRVYDSKGEAEYAARLDQEKIVGIVSLWLPQVAFPLPGKSRYILDFLVVNSDGSIRYIDFKGKDLTMSRLKRRQVKEFFNIDVEIVK